MIRDTNITLELTNIWTKISTDRGNRYNQNPWTQYIPPLRYKSELFLLYILYNQLCNEIRDD